MRPGACPAAAIEITCIGWCNGVGETEPIFTNDHVMLGVPGVNPDTSRNSGQSLLDHLRFELNDLSCRIDGDAMLAFQKIARFSAEKVNTRVSKNRKRGLVDRFHLIRRHDLNGGAHAPWQLPGKL